MSEPIDALTENNDPTFPVVDQGYNPDEVHRFVNEAQNLVARLLGENAELRTELKETKKVNPVVQQSTTMLIHAQEVSDNFISEAKRVAAETVAEADRVSGEKITEADEYSARVVGEANEEAERINFEAELRKEELTEQINALVSQRDAVAARVLAFHQQEVANLEEFIAGNVEPSEDGE